jgi:ketosteroid isomerase-like protein
MNASSFLRIVFLTFIVVVLIGCADNSLSLPSEETLSLATAENEGAFREVMQKHLDAVSGKDLTVLASTMSPAGNMQLILPGDEIIASVDSFLAFHEAWFQDTSWTFTTKILNVEVGLQVGMAIIEVVYREPEREGVPYFNRMTVSYTLRKMDGHWYVIKDHASSVEKSTDGK